MARAVGQPSKAEFAEHLRLHQGRLYGYIHSLVRDLTDADDLFQQTMLVLWKKFDEFDRQGNFFAWACGIARFEVANFLRTRARRKLYFSDELNLLLIEAHTEASEELEDRRATLAACIEALRQRDRELLVECYGDVASVPEVADRRGRSPHSVYNSLRRIRRALFECVARRMAQELRPGGMP
jgi:RNA polymerase sigma-70 factor, ECF subfamily